MKSHCRQLDRLICFFLYVIRRPIKPALAAVAEHLAGLVPLHLVYSHAHETAIEVRHMLEFKGRVYVETRVSAY